MRIEGDLLQVSAKYFDSSNRYQGPNYNEAVTINGKPVKAIVGQKVKNVAASARVKIPYNCQQGDCGTCMIKMNGRKVKACQMTIPAGKCTIETLN